VTLVSEQVFPTRRLRRREDSCVVGIEAIQVGSFP
jgi:hypothetical protein